MRVVRPEFEPALFAEAPFHERTEDRRIDVTPVEPGRFDDERQLVWIKVHSRRGSEQSAVHVWRAVIEAAACGLVGGGEHREQMAKLGRRRASRICDERLDNLFDRISSEQTEALGEKAPDQLEDEVADLADLIGRGPTRTPLVEAAHDGCSIGREPPAMREEERLLVR